MVDMSASPRIPTMEGALAIMKKICAVEKDAPGEIAAQMVLLDSHLERMAGFMAGVENIRGLQLLFGSAATLGNKIKEMHVNELTRGIGRYLDLRPDVAAKIMLSAKERAILGSAPIHFKEEPICSL